jgi:tetratricopeptide (TPR) repeat protein
VSAQPYKYLLAVAITGVFGLAPAPMFGQGAAAPASAAPQKNWKDRAEYDLFDSITKDTTPKTRLEKLQQWEKQYPMTEWIKERRTLLLTTYAAAGQPKQAVDEAKEILADDPKDFTALYYTMYFTQALYSQSQTPDVLEGGEKAAQAILAGIDTPPPNVTADQWSKLRPDIELMANVNLGFIAMQRKTWDAAEAAFQKTLQMSPNNAQVDYWMGTVIASEKKLDKLPAALFYFARAATYEGQGALPADVKKTALTYVQRQYKNYHGSEEGFNDLLASAKASPTPPAGFTIKNANEIAQAQAQSEDEWAKAHPEQALWKSIKAALTGAEGANYFASSMKDSSVPTLKGKVVKLDPATKPKTIQIAVDDGSGNFAVADATLKFEMALPGKVDEGTELSFQGVPESYTANPLMVVFNVDKDMLHGWTGKNEPAPVHRRPPAAKKQ